MLTHLSLFSGIGGLDLAAEMAGFTTVGQCEWADYPTKILEKHWPDVPRWRDIRTLTKDSFYERTKRETVDLISGGFPCQPHSVAGLHKASSDERDLWPEYRRVIGEIKPRWVVAENVRGLLSSEDGGFFRGILRDFSDLGFDVGWCCFRAADVGAIHARERIAIIAHTNAERLQGRMPAEERPETTEQFEGICVSLLRYETKERISRSSMVREFNGVSNRVDRTKCLGNAVVPQQFYPIFRAIAEIERNKEETE